MLGALRPRGVNEYGGILVPHGSGVRRQPPLQLTAFVFFRKTIANDASFFNK